MKRQPKQWDKIFANHIWEGVNIQNIQRTHTTQKKKKKLKMAKGSE